MTNLLSNSHVSLLFLIPGINETLRVNGTARISTDADLLADLAHDGKSALAAIVVTAREIFHHCAQALMRAHLWEPVHNAPACVSCLLAWCCCPAV